MPRLQSWIAIIAMLRCALAMFVLVRQPFFWYPVYFLCAAPLIVFAFLFVLVYGMGSGYTIMYDAAQLASDRSVGSAKRYVLTKPTDVIQTNLTMTTISATALLCMVAWMLHKCVMHGTYYVGFFLPTIDDCMMTWAHEQDMSGCTIPPADRVVR